MGKAPQQSSDFPDSFFRVAVKGVYVQNDTLLLGYDSGFPDLEPCWGLPGGGLDFGETFAEGLTREVKEEMGLTVTSVAETPSYIWTDRSENRRGMEWFHMLFLVFRFDVKSFDDFVPTEECKEMKFFSKDELLQLTNIHPHMKGFMEVFNPDDFLK